MNKDSHWSKIGVRVKVAASRIEDAGKSIVRIDSETYRKLKIQEGDILRIIGRGKITSATILASSLEDEKEPIIRMETEMRVNMGISLGEKVVIKSIHPSKADVIIISTPFDTIESIDSELKVKIEEKLRDCAVSASDIFTVDDKKFEILKTEPDGIVFYDNDTEIRFSGLRVLRVFNKMPNNEYIEDSELTTVELKVAAAKPRDVGRSIVRLDLMTLKKLKIRTGAIVKIEGKTRYTAAVVWPAYNEDQNQGKIRMDERIRKNTGVLLYEKVFVEKVGETTAREITLAPTHVRITSGDPYVESFIKKKLLSYPLTRGDVIYIPIGIAREVPFRIISTRPKGIVVVKSITILKVIEKPIGDGSDVMQSITFEDIGGLGAEIKRIKEIVKLPLLHPELFNKLDINSPNGILLYGISGCGKTLLAKAIGNEFDHYFKAIAAPELSSQYYGETEKKIRTIFEDVIKNAPSILFIDDIDSIASKLVNVTKHVEHSVATQLIAAIDKLKNHNDVILIAATNKLDLIPQDLRRPGRFDIEIEVGLPDKQGREEIIQIYSKKIPLEKEVNLIKIAARTEGFTGAEIEAIIRDATLNALRKVLPKPELYDSMDSDEILKLLKVTQKDLDLAEREIRKRKELNENRKV